MEGKKPTRKCEGVTIIFDDNKQAIMLTLYLMALYSRRD